MRGEHWTQEMLDTHIFVIIQEEMNKILEVWNHQNESSSKNQHSNLSSETLRN